MIVSKFIATHKMNERNISVNPNLFKSYSTALEVVPGRLKYIYNFSVAWCESLSVMVCPHITTAAVERVGQMLMIAGHPLTSFSNW